MNSKKIFVILPHLGGGGAERANLNLINEWSKKDFKIYLILIKKEGRLLNLLDKKVQVIDLNTDRIRKTIIPIYKLILNYKPNIILTSMWPLTSVVTISWILSFKIGKLFLSDHNPFIRDWANDINTNWLFFKLIYNFSYLLSSGTIALSKQLKKNIFSILFFKIDKIKIISNPVKMFDHHNFEIEKNKQKIFGNFQYHLISVGRLKKSRDFETLIESFNLLKYRDTSKLLILGEGPERTKIENLIKKNKLENNIKLLGFIDDPYPFIASSDVYIHSSLYDALPLIIIEALACGTKVVSTDCESGPREILENGKYGSLIPVKDAKSMALAIEKKLKETSNKNFLYERAENYSISKISNLYLNYFFTT